MTFSAVQFRAGLKFVLSNGRRFLDDFEAVKGFNLTQFNILEKLAQNKMVSFRLRATISQRKKAKALGKQYIKINCLSSLNQRLANGDNIPYTPEASSHLLK